MSQTNGVFNIIEGPLKVLGVYIGENEAQCLDIMWAKLLASFKKITEMWTMRNLTLKGKVIVINALCVSILTHILCVTSLPNGVLRDLNLAISNFLWKREKGLIAHNTLVAGFKDGGLKLIDVLTKKHSLRLKLIKKFLDPGVTPVWKDFMMEWVKAAGKCGIYNLCQIPPRPSLAGLGSLEAEILEAWRLLRPKVVAEPASLGQLLSLPLRYNPDVFEPAAGKYQCMVSGVLESVGVIRLGDLIDRTGKVNFDSLRQKFVANQVSFKSKYVKMIVCRMVGVVTTRWWHLFKQRPPEQGKCLNFVSISNHGARKNIAS